MQGTITEDSDAFLFGAKNVFKNIFLDKKYAEKYASNDIETAAQLRRDDLIMLAYVLGSDYATGVRGVGPIKGLDIIRTFTFGDPIERLQGFKSWLNSYNFSEHISKKVKGSQGSKTNITVEVDADAELLVSLNNT